MTAGDGVAVFAVVVAGACVAFLLWLAWQGRDQ